MGVSLKVLQASCAGCRDDYYNHGGHSSSGHCWGLNTAKKVKRWCIGMQTPMDKRERFRKVTVLSCYHGDGPYRDIYMKQLPSHLGGDWADPRERRESEVAQMEKKKEPQFRPKVCPICCAAIVDAGLALEGDRCQACRPPFVEEEIGGVVDSAGNVVHRTNDFASHTTSSTAPDPRPSVDRKSTTSF